MKERGKKLLEKTLAEELKRHPALKDWNHRRRLASIREKVADDEPVIELFSKLVRVEPTIAELFGLGKHFRGVLYPPTPEKEYQGSRFPYELEFKKGKSGKYTKECPINGVCYVDCVTDAANDYLSRLDRPGHFIEPKGVFKSFHGPWNGNFRVYLAPPKNAQVGDEYQVKFGFMDDSRLEPLEVYLILRISKAEKKRPKPPRPRPKLNIPNTVSVYRQDWGLHDMTQESAVAIKKGENNEVDIFINMDNQYLLQELSLRSTKGSEEFIKKQFKVAMVIVGLALYQNLRESEGEAEHYGDYREAASAVAKVILPIIRALGSSTTLILKQAS